jgi:hypothetical protein
MSRLCFTILVAAFIAGPAQAQEATVASGVSTLIAHPWSMDRNCRGQRLSLRITSPPAHGKVTFRSGTVTVPATAPGGPVSSQCVGRSVSAVAVYYRSERGFVGEDRFSFVRINLDNASDRLNGEKSRTVSVR